MFFKGNEIRNTMAKIMEKWEVGNPKAYFLVKN